MIFIPYIFGGHDSPQWVMASSFTRFLDHTQRRATVGRTPLDEWSARRRDLYLTTHDTHNRQISMPPVGFEPTISADERPQTYALDRTATETGYSTVRCINYLHSQVHANKILKLFVYITVHTRIVTSLQRQWVHAVGGNNCSFQHNVTKLTNTLFCQCRIHSDLTG